MLAGSVAQPLRATGTALRGGWELYRGAGGWTLRGAGAPVTVNGAAYRAGQVLVSGDAIAIGAGESLLLIEVAS